jgi:uncharacterized protein (TIGR02145 family)
MKTIKDYILQEKLILKKNINTEHECVDLGLPSGTLWATCNIGANNPWETGDYFAWGETETKQLFTFETYTLFKKNNRGYDTKYNSTDKLTELEKADDVVYNTYGEDWEMPAFTDFIELCNNTKMDFIINYKNSKQNGWLFTNKKDSTKFIFIPAGGKKVAYDLLNYNEDSNYWTNTRNMFKVDELAYSWGLTKTGKEQDINTQRYVGRLVRGIKR